MYTAKTELWIVRRYGGGCSIERVLKGHTYNQINYDGGVLVATALTESEAERQARLFDEIREIENRALLGDDDEDKTK